jgi:hypothetical protein
MFLAIGTATALASTIPSDAETGGPNSSCYHCIRARDRSTSRLILPRFGATSCTCSHPLGPCSKVTTSGPWMASHDQAVGPGGPTFFEDAAGGLHIGYHAWSPGKVGYEAGGVRSLWIDRLTFVNGQPVTGGT